MGIAMSRMQAILCDIDGTIALRGDRAPHDHESSMEDAVNYPIVQICDAIAQRMPVILVTGRDECHRDVTEYWLGAHNIMPYRQALIMRPAGDQRPDEIVKRELYEQQIQPHYDVLFVLDDRDKVVKMWRQLGLACLQVAEGNF